MLLNRKCVSLGVTLFSAMIFATLANNQTVKADTTSNSTTGTTTPTTTSSTTTSAAAASPVVTTTTTDIKTGTTTTTSPAATAPVSSSTGTTSPVSSTTSSSTTTTGSTSSTSATAPVNSSTSTVTSTSSTGTSAPKSSTTTTGTGSTDTTTAGTGGGITFTTQPATTATAPISSTTTSTTSTAAAGTTTPPTTTTGTTTPTTTNSYAIPSDVTDSTVVTFTDPLLGSVVKQNLNIKPTDDITVGDIKNFNEPNLDISIATYQLQQKKTPGASMTDQQSTPIESLNGMQYLSLLPSKTQILFDAKLASDPSSNPDLTPLDNLNFGNLVIDGDFSDSNAKEIDLSQLNNIKSNNMTYLELSGDQTLSPTSGLNNKTLAEAAPYINKFANNGLDGNLLELGYSSISDFTPLKPAETAKDFTVIAATNTVVDPTPAYAVTGSPITFTAPKLLDPSGNDLAANYHFSYSTAQADLADDNLTNLGNDNYELMKPAPNVKTLFYGDLGFEYTLNKDAYVNEHLGGMTFRAIDMNAQPLIWQTSPTVTVNYQTADGKPIETNGAAMTKVLDGSAIGATYDLTADSSVAGYTLTSPTSSLKGTYTENPQVINLVYSPIVKKPVTTPTTTTSTTTSTTPTTSIVATPKSSEAVQIYDVTGSSPNSAFLSDIGVKETTMINGQLFYQVGYGQWVPATDFNTVASAKPGIVRTFSNNAHLVNSEGLSIPHKLATNTEWKYSKIVVIDGQSYYQVATDEFLPVKSGVEFTPTVTKTNVNVISKAVLYNSEGESLTTTLPSGSNWATDGCAIINGVKMYRVASDEWVSADNTNAVVPKATTYHAATTTTLYDATGKALPNKLAAGTNWKVDQVIENGSGQHFYRVATNEYVRDYADDVK